MTISRYLDSGFDDVAAHVRKVWARRAARLAQVPEEQDQGAHLPLVLIRLGTEIYALDAQFVFNIRPVVHLTPVPRTPEWVAGVVNLRGRIISVLDLARFFGLSQAQAEQTTEDAVMTMELDDTVAAAPQYLVVVETSKLALALLVDEVLAVKSVPASHIQAVNDMMILNIRADYVRGTVQPQTPEEQRSALHAERHHDAIWVILDLPALLGDKRLIIQEDLT